MSETLGKDRSDNLRECSFVHVVLAVTRNTHGFAVFALLDRCFLRARLPTTKMVRAIGTDAFTESEERWRCAPFGVLPLRTVRRAGRLRRQVQRPLEGYIHVPTDYRGTAYRSRR